MTTICRAFPTEDEARTAVERLRAAGISGADIRLVMGVAVQDRRDAPVGQFAGDDREAAIGSFAGERRSSHTAMGGFAGDPERQRRGGFGDLDRDTVTTYADGVRRVHIRSHRNLEKMLIDAGLSADAAAADVAALHHGRILVLARAGSMTAEAEMALDAPASV